MAKGISTLPTLDKVIAEPTSKNIINNTVKVSLILKLWKDITAYPRQQELGKDVHQPQ